MQVIKIDSSCFQTNLNLSKPNAHVCSLVPHAQDYVRFYYMLKGQRSMVSCLIPSIEELLPQVETFEGNVLNTLKNHINVLLNAKFGNFYQIANEVIIEIYSNLLKANVSSEISKIVLKALKATLAITRNLSKFQIDKKFISRLFSNMVSGSDEDEVQQSCQKVNFTNQDFIICRICDKRVRSECFEEHTESCIKAYQNETRINAINNDLLDILKFLITNYLSGPWPGTKNTSISLSFPIFHLCFLLNRVCDINPRDADASDELQTLFVSFDYFSSCTLPNEVMIEISRIKKKVNEKRCISNAVRENIEFLSNTQINSDDTPSFATPTTISNFQLIKRISSGAFARVFLAKKKSTGDIYAIKVQPINDVIQKNQVKRVLAEKDILLQFSNPYIINFYYSFSGTNNLYLVMEYLPGGDLYSLLQNVSAIEEDSAKIYTFQIAKALGYLHSRGIIHRDIKPDNILIAADGSLRLTDFGLSYIGCVDRQVSEKPSSNDKIVEAKSLVGTPDYIAPEIILNLSHSFTVDWWSLGIMVYEFIMGIPPFHGKTIDETKDLILKGDYIKPNIENPDISDDCADFIDSLLQQNPHKRLGNNGLEEVLNHKWLKSLSNIDNLQSPFIPELANDLDTSYFEERYSPNGSDDSDIFEDIRREEKQHYSRHSSSPKQVGNSSFLASLSDADGDDNNFDSDMNNFPSVSVEQLMNTNRIISKSHVRGRSSSFMTQEDSSNTSSDSPIVSKSFMGLNPAAGSRRKKTISSFGQYYASANDLKNLILSAKIKK